MTSYFFSFGVGAVQLCTPLLLPRNRQIYEHNEAALFMDHSGMLVMLPFDLRVRLGGFANSVGAMPGPRAGIILKEYPHQSFFPPRLIFLMSPLGNIMLRELSG